MRFQSIFFFLALILTVMAVPEIEHDREEFDIHDCKFFTSLSCIRECPRGYVGVYRDLCFAAEDQHECCAVRCCRSRHNGDQEADGIEGGNINRNFQAGLGRSN
ncbi:hypothetical protein BCR42DRAFT_440037 [Absidia repens]|uniref:Uncharacterized protein n=1 Tax=Absidia repens TaxID=90262 RepID=A0A1X2I9P9_9FUNG|nr:hypothetical protein BCR42DRAFT_440037 [Absidia repens]